MQAFDGYRSFVLICVLSLFLSHMHLLSHVCSQGVLFYASLLCAYLCSLIPVPLHVRSHVFDDICVLSRVCSHVLAQSCVLSYACVLIYIFIFIRARLQPQMIKHNGAFRIPVHYTSFRK